MFRKSEWNRALWALSGRYVSWVFVVSYIKGNNVYSWGEESRVTVTRGLTGIPTHSLARSLRHTRGFLQSLGTQAAGRSLSVSAPVGHSGGSYSTTAADAADDVENVDTVGWGSTKVGTLLTAKPKAPEWLWCEKDMMVIDAIKKMTEANVGSLMVVDCEGADVCRHKEEAVVGIMTERDYLTKVVVKGRNSHSTKVCDIMTPVKDLMMVTPKNSVLDVMELMVEKNFRHVPVVEACGTMAGMVSIKDVVHVMLKEHREEVGRLNEYIQGTF